MEGVLGGYRTQTGLGEAIPAFGVFEGVDLGLEEVEGGGGGGCGRGGGGVAVGGAAVVVAGAGGKLQRGGNAAFSAGGDEVEDGGGRGKTVEIIRDHVLLLFGTQSVSNRGRT